MSLSHLGIQALIIVSFLLYLRIRIFIIGLIPLFLCAISIILGVTYSWESFFFPVPSVLCFVTLMMLIHNAIEGELI